MAPSLSLRDGPIGRTRDPRAKLTKLNGGRPTPPGPRRNPIRSDDPRGAARLRGDRLGNLAS
eukprot:763371-Hanusia_phi.AAC.1